MAFPYLRRHNNTGRLGFSSTLFFAKRAVRILPPYYIAVGVFALLSFVPLWRLTSGTEHGHAMTAHLTLRALGAHLAFMARDYDLLNTSFWTLRIEAIWYFIFPLLLVAYVQKKPLFFAIGAACSLAAMLHVFKAPFETVDKMMLALPAFMLGIVAADMQLKRISQNWWLVGVLVASLILGTVADFAWAPWARLPWDACAFSFVALAGSQRWLRRGLTLPLATAIGIASYSMYLVHEPLIAVLEYVGVPAVAAAAAAMVAGALFWFLVERPLSSDPIRKNLVDGTERSIRGLLARARPVRRVSESSTGITPERSGTG